VRGAALGGDLVPVRGRIVATGLLDETRLHTFIDVDDIADYVVTDPRAREFYRRGVPE
jgi:hypothetical protein